MTPEFERTFMMQQQMLCRGNAGCVSFSELVYENIKYLQ